MSINLFLSEIRIDSQKNYMRHFLFCLIAGSKERKKQINKGEYLHENFYRPNQRQKKKVGESGEIIRPASCFPAEIFFDIH